MTDRERVIECLRAAGVDRQDDGLYVVPYTGIGVDLANPEDEPDTVRITMPMSEAAERLPALLSPLTLDVVEQAVKWETGSEDMARRVVQALEQHLRANIQPQYRRQRREGADHD